MLFKKKTKSSGLPKAMVFVDFEHWYISLEKNFHRRPQIRKWRDSLASEFDIADIYFFADFSNTSMQSEVSQIREVTNFIIETGNTHHNFIKDFTDFIMLDRIYQTSFERSDIDAYIIFSGDGHFSSVIQFLTQKQGKTVGVYGIRDSISHRLMTAATWVRELPELIPEYSEHRSAILGNLNYLENNKKGKRDHYPAFRPTVDAVSRYFKFDRDETAAALRELMDFGYVEQIEVEFPSGKKIKVLKVNKERIVSDGADFYLNNK